MNVKQKKYGAYFGHPATQFFKYENKITQINTLYNRLLLRKLDIKMIIHNFLNTLKLTKIIKGRSMQQHKVATPCSSVHNPTPSKK